MKSSNLVALACVSGGLLASPSIALAEPCDPPRILFVIDASSSMLDNITEAGVTSQKWQVTQDAVKAVSDAYPEEAQYGLMTFPGPSGSCATGTVLVDVGAGTGPQIQSTLSSLSMSGAKQTPAGQSLMAASQYAGITDPFVKNFVIFMTDGWQYCSIASTSAPVCQKSTDCSLMNASPCPTCNSCSVGSSDPACLGKTADGCYCVRSWPVLGVEALAASGVSTYVVGFGTSADVKTLNAAANAGGTALSGCDPSSSTPSCYYQASAPSELNAALADIVQKVVTEICNGDCGIQGSRTCTASGWSPCVAPTEVDCQGPCGTSGKQYCQSGTLSQCDAFCEDSGVGGAGGSGGTTATGGSGGTGNGGKSGSSGASGKGGSSGASGKAGASGSSAGGGSGKAGSSSGKGGSWTNPDAGYGGGDEPPPAQAQSGDDGGCGCRTTGSESRSRALLLFASAIAASLLARKRRRG